MYIVSPFRINLWGAFALFRPFHIAVFALLGSCYLQDCLGCIVLPTRQGKKCQRHSIHRAAPDEMWRLCPYKPTIQQELQEYTTTCAYNMCSKELVAPSIDQTVSAYHPLVLFKNGAPLQSSAAKNVGMHSKKSSNLSDSTTAKSSQDMRNNSCPDGPPLERSLFGASNLGSSHLPHQMYSIYTK